MFICVYIYIYIYPVNEKRGNNGNIANKEGSSINLGGFIRSRFNALTMGDQTVNTINGDT